MDKLSVGHLLRFGFAGVAAFLGLYYVAPSAATAFASVAGPIGFPLSLLAIGSLAYFVYRPLVFDLLIWPFLRSSAGYRRYLHREYGVNESDTDRAWRLIQRLYPPGEGSEYRVWTSGIHFTYLSGISALAAGIGSALGHAPVKAAWAVGTSVICLTAALRNNILAERAEFDRLRALPRSEVARAVEHFLHASGIEEGDLESMPRTDDLKVTSAARVAERNAGATRSAILGSPVPPER